MNNKARKCPVCLSQKTEIFCSNPKDYEYHYVSSKIVSYFRCLDCLCIFQDPMPSTTECLSYYPPDYQNYSSSDIPFLGSILNFQQIRAAKSFINKFGRDATILDFGCGDGLFLNYLEKCGATNLYGFEPSHRDSAVIPHNKVKITAKLEFFKERQIKFDVIRLNHVIEHIPDLDAQIALLLACLNKNGVLVGQTPNTAHFTARLFVGVWGALHYPYHTILFSSKGLSTACVRWGAEIAQLDQTIMPTGWSMSFENLLKKIFKIQKRGRLSIYPLLIFIGVSLSILERVFHQQTSVFDFQITKK